MIFFFFSIAFALWCRRELRQFAIRLNKQAYADLNYLLTLDLSEKAFMEKSQLNPKQSNLSWFFLFIFPSLSLLDFYFSLIFMILCFLALLDMQYYLTDTTYVALIFMLSLGHLLFRQPENVEEHLFSLLAISLFLTAFYFLTKLIYQKEVFGLGDIIILSALSPLFNLQEMLILLFMASTSGLIWAFFYKLYFKQKLSRLPFVPFICFSSFIVVISKY
ncbi:hypothetical protein A4G20_09050 [Pasteurellaceae bacterium RH1A]|nr:hypothetical protein A4G20_09050 [Pasteurellaceae bacterium RH1A]